MNMTQQKYVDTDLASFAEDVIQASTQQLVMVDFWAEWCGPCRSLGPILESLVDQYQGALKLVKVDADQHQELTAQFGIRSLPTVFFFKDGNPVDQFMGAQPESAIKAIIDKHIGGAAVSELEQVAEAYDSGHKEEAKAYVGQLIAADENNEAAKLLMLGWLTSENNMDAAKSIADSISEEGHSAAEYKGYLAKVELNKDMEGVPQIAELEQLILKDEDNLEARYQLAQRLIAEQDYSGGMDQLLEMIKRNRQFQDEAARKLMLKVFALLGGKGETVSRYRSLLSRLLN